MKLVIIEGIGKKDTIKKYLGSDYEVLATKGHIRDLPEKAFGVNISKNFEPNYTIISDKKSVVEDLKRKAKNAEKIYLATDPDREGEAISWHLAYILGLKPEDPVRITFNEISKNAVTHGLENPRIIDQKLVDAQQARRILDRIVGYKVSPILCKKIAPKLSAGRVQSATLKILVDREKEIQNFKPEDYYVLPTIFYKDNKQDSFKANLAKYNNKKINVKDSSIEESNLEELKNGHYIVKNIKRSVGKTHPTPPYTTSTMQQDALNKLNFNLKKTTRLAQSLYEGVEIEGHGKTALVTYIRSDSVRLAPEAISMARNFILNHFGKDYLPAKENVYKTKAQAQDAHEAIRPINVEFTPSSLKGKIRGEGADDLLKLYEMIYNKFLACQMADATYNSVIVEIENGNCLFKANGKTPIFDGFTLIYNLKAKKKKQDESEDEEENSKDKKPPQKTNEEHSFCKENNETTFKIYRSILN